MLTIAEQNQLIAFIKSDKLGRGLMLHNAIINGTVSGDLISAYRFLMSY